MGKIIDIVFEGTNFTKLLFIISDKNEEIATIYFNKKEVKNDVINIILNSYKIVDKKCEKPELIKQIIK